MILSDKFGVCFYIQERAAKVIKIFPAVREDIYRIRVSKIRMTDGKDITALLRQSDPVALEQLFPIVYDKLREIAGALFQHQYRANHTLQPTALVHEVYLKLVGSEVSWQSRAHFFGTAARAMRQILVNHAEAHNAEKRGGGKTLLTLDGALSFFETQDIEILALNEALEKMAAFDRRQAHVVELKFFGGLTNEETAEVLKVSPVTVRRDWETARLWLRRALK